MGIPDDIELALKPSNMFIRTNGQRLRCNYNLIEIAKNGRYILLLIKNMPIKWFKKK